MSDREDSTGRYRQGLAESLDRNGAALGRARGAVLRALSLTERPFPLVLVVEDDVTQLRIWGRALAGECSVLAAQTMVDALAFVEGIGRLDLAVVDLMLPDGTGYDVAVAARRRWPRLPIILFSGHVTTEWAARFEALGPPVEIHEKPSGAIVDVVRARLRTPT